MKISVLTAVYNTEPYLRECLDSLRNQTLTDAEFICIDDASTDGCPRILDDYAAHDARFRIIHLSENKGLAAARNAGLHIAQGQYIMTLDSDDWLAYDALQQAYDTLQQHPEADITLLRLMFCQDGTMHEFQNRTDKTMLTGEEAFRLSIDHWKIHGLYLIRNSLHQQYPYDETRPTYSDENVTYLHYLHAHNVVFSQGIYYYRQHAQSVTKHISIRRFDRLDANLSMKHALEREAAQGNINHADEILRQYEEYRWLKVIDSWWFYYQHRHAFSKEEHQQIEERFRNILPTIQKERIATRLKMKPGYYPFRSFRVFKFFENLYCLLKNTFHPTPGG